MGALAITGGPRVRPADRKWPAWPIRGAEERALVDEVVRQGPWSYEGPKEREFAQRFASYLGCKHGFCVANGTVSIEIALRAAGIRPGDEVIVPALTWIATASAPMYAGATVVFVDIDPDTYQVDPAQVEAAITPKTRAVLPVHLYCRIPDMDAIRDLARRHSLIVVEDCAHGHGGVWNGQKTGSMGDLGSFSFQESKVITSGEGGFISTDDDRLAEMVYGVKNCGRTQDDEGDSRYVLGGNYRMTEMQAALLLAQLGRLDGQVEHRDRSGKWLDAELSRIEGLRPLRRDPRIQRQSYYDYVFRYDAASFGGAPVEVFAEALKAEGIPVDSGTYGPVYSTDLWGPADHQSWRVASSHVADRVDEEALNVSHPVLLAPEEDLAQMVEAVRKVRDNYRELQQVTAERSGPASVKAPRHTAG